MQRELAKIALFVACGFVLSGIASAAKADTFSQTSQVSSREVAFAPVWASLMVSYVSVKNAEAGKPATVAVTSKNGDVTEMEIPADAAARGDLHAGDRLEFNPDANGAMLTKNDKPVVYLLRDMTALAYSHELAR